MVLYLTIIIAAYVVISLLNGAFVAGYAPSFAHAAATVAVLAAIDAAAALATRWCIPEDKMNPFHPVFNVAQRERKIYERLGIRKWKDVIPESGKYLVGFAKDKIADHGDNAYLLKFLRETCYAEIMHVASFVLGFAALIFMPYRLTMVLPAAIVNAFLQLLPVLVQRYNRCRIKILYKYNQKREKNESN